MANHVRFGWGFFRDLIDWTPATVAAYGQPQVKAEFLALASEAQVTVSPAVTAFAGGGQASATAISLDFSNITVCATAGDSVKLPAATVGKTYTITNRGAASANVFPATGDTINGGAANAAIALPVGATYEFIAINTTDWKTNQVTLAAGDGTAALPSHTFSTQPNMGLYKVSSTQLGVSVAGVLQAVVNSGTGGIQVGVIVELVGGVGVTVASVLLKEGGVKMTAPSAVGVEMVGGFTDHMIYLHPTSLAAGKRALRIGDYGTETPVVGGEGLIRTYAKTDSGTGATALQFHWGLNTVAAVDLIGNQMQFESQVAAVGSETLLGNDIIVGIAANDYMATTAGSMTKGLIGGRFKVYADATSTCNGSVAALWLDNQMSCAVAETECSIRSSTGGSVPDAWALFTTTSAGWAQLLTFDATMAGVAPKDTSFTGNAGFASNNKGTFTLAGGLKMLDGATQYWIPYGVLSN